MKETLLITILSVGLFLFIVNRDSNTITQKKTVSYTVPKHSLVMFYAPWCGYCKQFMPEWEQVKSSLRSNPKIRTVEVNGDDNKDLMMKYNVPGFPTILLELNDGTVIPYDGNRDAHSVLDFASRF